MNLSETLPELLAAKGMTQDHLAAKIGMKRTDLNAIAKGRVQVGERRLARIAGGLGVSIIELDRTRGREAGDPAYLTFDHRLVKLEAEALTLEDLGPLLRVVQLLTAGKTSEAQRVFSEARLTR